jgi:ammonium transporter, Amt family
MFRGTLIAQSLFDGGLVWTKNVLSVLMQCLIILCVITLRGSLFVYSLTFGPDTGQPNTNDAVTIPHCAFMILQCMFAVITPALIIGTYAERIKFSAFLAFTVLWATFVYDPQGHWVRGTGGWLKDFGAYRKQMKTRRESWR